MKAAFPMRLAEYRAAAIVLPRDMVAAGFVGWDGEHWVVPLPARLAPEERAERLERLRSRNHDIQSTWFGLGLLADAGAGGPIPPAWRPDIAWEGGAELRAIVWAIENDPDARRGWDLLEPLLLEAPCYRS